MSKAKAIFETSMRDAEDLLAHFDALPKPPPANVEALTRAGLATALTAWEIYVEDRVVEAVNARLGEFPENAEGRFMVARLDEDLRRFYNPTSDNTRKLFRDYTEVDVAEKWSWPHYETDRVKTYLDDLMAKRGDAVHRSRQTQQPTPAPHLVKRDELERAIRFLTSLVAATDDAFRPEPMAN